MVDDLLTTKLRRYGVGAGWHTSLSDPREHYTTRIGDCTSHVFRDGSMTTFCKNGRRSVSYLTLDDLL